MRNHTESKNGARRPRGIRAFITVLAVTLVLAGIGASSSWTAPSPSASSSPAAASPAKSYVAPALLAKASNGPDERIRVIIQSAAGTAAAEKAFESAGGRNDGGRVNRRLGVIGAVAVELRGKQIERLASVPGLTITPDAAAKADGTFSSAQLWPMQTGNAKLWGPIDFSAPAKLPAIAVVDSGIDASRADFSGRLLAEVNLTTATPNSPGDGRGHGTFVAGIAAGGSAGYAGAAPGAKLVSIDVFNDAGMAWTSDVIAAAEWILQNKDKYGIRVANFSLHASTPSSFTVDPLDKAVEKLWFSGVTVVASAGNYGTNRLETVRYAPANDPFVITVGAVDLGGTARIGDDAAAPWSVYGYTYDGFFKPEVGTAGRYMVGAVPVGSTIASALPGNVVAPGYIQLSGTSFAAPVVAGAAAHILALHPEYTPDQVKGAIMVTARQIGTSTPSTIGVGELNAIRAATYVNPPNPNFGLNRFLVPDPRGGSLPVFDAASWNNAVQGDASWNSASWNSASWNSASWNSASWNSASWTSASWNSASWNSASWNDASWNDMSQAANVLGEANPAFVADLTLLEQAALDSDPDLAPLTPLP